MVKKHLYFDYPSTAKIRFKAANCYESPDYPYIYMICTKRLNFSVPKSMTMIGKKYVYIPLAYYRNVITEFYKKISLVD